MTELREAPIERTRGGMLSALALLVALWVIIGYGVWLMVNGW